MKIERIAAFSHGEAGGNPAGVAICETFPPVADMQATAARLGYSETVFAMPVPMPGRWRVRYFAPAMEVPFCGHATIALGAALAWRDGGGVFHLALNEASVTVEAHPDGALAECALQSPPTRSDAVPSALTDAALRLFGLDATALDPRLPPALAEAGARHLVLLLRDRETLRGMDYVLEDGRRLMAAAGLVTIMLAVAQGPQDFDTRHAFAAGGVKEDPATGAGAAAFAGLLRDAGWPHGGDIRLRQGDDMGQPCRLRAKLTQVQGESVRVSGTARRIN